MLLRVVVPRMLPSLLILRGRGATATMLAPPTMGWRHPDRSPRGGPPRLPSHLRLGLLPSLPFSGGETGRERRPPTSSSTFRKRQPHATVVGCEVLELWDVAIEELVSEVARRVFETLPAPAASKFVTPQEAAELLRS